MTYQVLAQFFVDGKRHVLGTFDYGTERVRDDRNPEFIQAAMRAANVTDVRDMYAIIPA